MKPCRAILQGITEKQPTIIGFHIMKYTAAKPVTIHSIDTTPPKVGQWVNLDGSKGQYLGHTAAGVAVVRWNHGQKFTKTAARNNFALRLFATGKGRAHIV
jgi:hypothetical protein